MILLKELAIEKRRLEDRLMDKSDQLILHLFKIFYHGTTSDRIDHWSGDLYDILYWIPSLKGKKRFLDRKTIYYNLWGYVEDRFSVLSRGKISQLNRMSKGEKEGFGRITDTFPNERCKRFCSAYFDWLSSQLSLYGEVSEEEVRNEIRRLLK